MNNVTDSKFNVNTSDWSATDELGRSVPSAKETGKVRKNKYVGVFYWTWHYNFASGFKARNATHIMEKNPEAVNDFDHPAWGGTKTGTPYHWDEPLFGYYSNLDEYVLRKHAELLGDAGADVVIFDCTNGTYTWEPAYLKVLKVFSEAKEQGVNVPKIAFMMNFCPNDCSREELKSIYGRIYSSGLYKDLWFYWDGKPLVMAHPECLSDDDPYQKEIKEFFTFRRNMPSYFDPDFSIDEKKWGWCSVYPQAKYGVRPDGTVEQMTVNVAQNANDRGLCAMNANGGRGVYGRSYTKGDYSYSYKKNGKDVTVSKDTENAVLYGLNFQQQWDYALETDPDFIFVTGWNEWIAGRHTEWEGTKNAFPDQFDVEHSRDSEPSAGVLRDNYYYQLAANIRRFKGQKPAKKHTKCEKTIDINGDLSQWKSVDSDYFHYRKSTYERNFKSWGENAYTCDAVRNDIVLAKVAYDSENVYFLAVTDSEISPKTDEAWMRLLIKTDDTGKIPSWEGFNFIVNRVNPSAKKAVLEKAAGNGFEWKSVAKVDYRVCGKYLQIKIPRKYLGLEGAKKPSFAFKWADNNLKDGEILTLYKEGKAAPGGRFMFDFTK